MPISRMVIVSLAALAWLTPGCTPTGFLVRPVSAQRKLQEQELQRDAGWVSDKVALIDVNGVIMNRAQPGLLSKGEHPVSVLVEKLKAAREDDSVKAAVLRINSPGGGVTASAIMHEEISRFRAAGKPVVAIMMDVAASGGYYIACACDEILAYPTSVTGSIGVIMQTLNLSGMMTKFGVSAEAIKSGPRKDVGSPFKPLEDEDRAILQSVIDDMFERFIDVVDEGRPDLSRGRILELADGRIYTARQAVDAGLVDGLGTLHLAISRAKARAGIERCRVVTYQRPLSWHPNIYARSANPAAQTASVNIVNLEWPSWLKPGEAQFMYLWTP